VFSPRAAVTTRLWQGGTLKAIYSEAFRAPSYFESEAHSPIPIAAGSLVPERTDSRELVIEQRIARHRLAINLFDTRFRQLVDLVTLTPGEARA
jgi:outer membrane receptor protein involved in Fe transport